MTGLVLWDVDRTLIDTRGVGRELSASAFLQTTGQPTRQQARIDDFTEPVIFRETAKLHGLTTDRTDFERFARALTAAHLEHAADSGNAATHSRARPPPSTRSPKRACGRP